MSCSSSCAGHVVEEGSETGGRKKGIFLKEKEYKGYTETTEEGRIKWRHTERVMVEEARKVKGAEAKKRGK
jgi:hypothetical protein